MRELRYLPFKICLTLLVVCQAAHALEQAQAEPTFAFVRVNVIPMDRERVLRDQTVLIRDGKIAAIGSDLPVPAGARAIDGHGTAYLLPGLADMHTHSETRNDLAVYLANGVTTILHMGGARAGFVDTIVPRVNKGAIPGPHVYTSFLVDGSTDYNGFVVKTPAQARAIVGLAKTNGYDFIKVYVGLSPDVFAALADEGRRRHIPLVGHGVTAVRLERQLAAGQVLVAHLEEFFYTFFTPQGAEESDTPPDPSRISQAITLAKSQRAAVTADLATYAAIAHQMGHPEVLTTFLSQPEIVYLSPSDRLAWLRSEYVAKTARLGAKLEFLRLMTKAMADSDVELVAGTDAPAVPGLLPGFSLHEDLAELEHSGLTRFQVLSSATRAPGSFIARTKGGQPFGQVTTGYRADLILTADNPLSTLSTLSTIRTPLGVMANGRWRDAAGLKDLLNDVRESYQRASNPRPISSSSPPP